MPSDLNPYEASQHEPAFTPNRSSFVTRLMVYLALGFAGLVVGAHISVHVGDAWYPDDADGNYIGQTIAAVISSPLAMTFGLFPSFGFYGPWHGLFMLVGMLLTASGTWLHFRSRRLVFSLLVFVGTILWSHNNHLAFAALMSV